MFYSLLTCLIALILGYMFTEGRPWHRPIFEFVFWIVVFASSLYIALLSYDSPLLWFISLNPNPLVQFFVFFIAIPVYSSMMSQFILAGRLVSFNDREKNHEGRFKYQILYAAARNAEQNTESARDSFRSSRQVSKRRLSLEDGTINEGLLLAKAKMQFISLMLYRLTYYSYIRRFASYLRGHIEERQNAVRAAFENCNTAELNFLLCALNVAKLLNFAVDLHKSDNLLSYIVENRSEELNTMARASIIHGVMRTDKIQFFPREREYVTRLFCEETGVQMTLLKNMLDSSGDFNNLYKLIYLDNVDIELRDRMLKHIAEEARSTKREFENEGHRPIKIMSDVDDTLSCSGGSFPAGSDTRYPKKAVYPGVLALFREIDQSARASSKHNKAKQDDEEAPVTKVKVRINNPSEYENQDTTFEAFTDRTLSSVLEEANHQYHVAPRFQNLSIIPNVRSVSQYLDAINEWEDGNIVFVSARPHVFRNLSENASYRKFAALVRAGKMHATPTMLAGNLKAGLSAVAIRYAETIKIKMEELSDFAVATKETLKQKIANWQGVRRNSNAHKEAKSTNNEEDIDNYDDDLFMDDDSQGISDLVEKSTRASTSNQNWEAVGKAKVDSMLKFSHLFPEYDIVFFGDNGQGDLLASELLNTTEKPQSTLRYCFIHKIQSNTDASLLSAFSKDEREKRWQECNIVFFETYVEAATAAYERGLISLEGLFRVGVSVHDELTDLFIRHPRRDWSKVVDITERDIRRANTKLTKIKKEIPIPQQPKLDI